MQCVLLLFGVNAATLGIAVLGIKGLCLSTDQPAQLFLLLNESHVSTAERGKV